MGEEIWTAEQNIKNHKKAIDEDEKAVEEAREEIELTEEAVRNLTDATEDGTRASAEAAAQEAKLLDVFAATEEALDNVREAYISVYLEVQNSLNGVFGLFEKVEEKQTTTMKEITAALSSQAAYFAEYRDNLATVAEAAEQSGIDLSGVWSKLTDGSQESAAAVAAMAKSVKNGDVGELRAYVDQFNDLQEKILSLSDLIAQEDKTVKDALAQAEKDIAEAVANTEASEEAYNAMEATIQGYLDDLNGSGNGVGRVNAAIAAAGERWKKTIANLFTTSSPLMISTEKKVTWRDVPTVQESFSKLGYATGTDNAPPGWAWVGEEGPELMRMRGGEQILPAEISRRLAENYSLYDRYTAKSIQTARVLESGGNFRSVDDSVPVGEFNLNMKFEVSNNATPETVRALRDYSGEIKEVVRRVIREERIDARRRSFA